MLPWKESFSMLVIWLLLSHTYLGERIKLKEFFAMVWIELWSRMIESNWVNLTIWSGTRVSKLRNNDSELTGLIDGVVRKTSRISLTLASPKRWSWHSSAIVLPSPALSATQPQGTYISRGGQMTSDIPMFIRQSKSHPICKLNLAICIHK